NGSTYEPMVSYTIDWGDGSAIETVFNDGLFDDSHIYTNDGQYQIIITAADDDGDVYTQVESITVETVVPEIALTLPATAIASKNIQPNIQHIGGDEAIAYTLDWGDGSEPAFLEPGMTVPNHSYIQAGTYTVTLTALDDDGDIVTVNQTITTNNAPPVIENQSFAIAIDNSPDQDLFTLEPTTGNLSVKSPPDFEAPVDGDRDQIDVQVSDDVNPISQTLDITVINVEESQSQPDNITVAKAGTSPSHMNGTKQADRLAGTDAKDVMSGGGGGDHLKGGAGDDTLMGDGGKDKLFGGVGNDHIEGGNGKDLLKGQAGDDILLGGRGADRLFGNSGDDLLDGGKGRDRYVGGNGADTFVLRLGEGVDTIRDFRLSQGDTIALADGLRFRDLTIKPLGNHGAKLFAEDKLLATVQSNRFDAINTNEAFSSL
ncbi:MAG: PKD domain-containing protein, partial [Cyanobacteria bacterium P01_F01_bin.150]